ncbi:hypothetical protein CEP53_012329 [Fusarium sp. AF-6]|nr:hypothetical protein CEP53_012329 [Fusarium sp. AF-6]
MTQQLCGRDLQILRVATQERDNWAKLMGAWNSNNISLFWVIWRIIKVSYLPCICFVDLNVVQDILHSKATKCWSTTSWESRHSNKTPDSIFQATGTVKILVSVYLPAVNFLGSTSLPDISEIIMKMVIGVHLIGCYLCELQDRKGSPLTETEVKAAMRGFEESVERGKMSRGISPEMVSISFEERDCTEEVTQAVIRVAKEAAVSSLESLFQELRQNDQSQY